MRLRWPLTLTAALLVAPTAAQAVAPTVMPGWPVATITGRVFPAGGGAAAVAGPTVEGYDAAIHAATGRRAWAHFEEDGCGNCSDLGNPTTLSPDGVIGPIGTQENPWAFHPVRRELVPVCRGATTYDAQCITHEPGTGDTPPPSPHVSSRVAGTVRWTYTRPDSPWHWAAFLETPPRVFAPSPRTFTLPGGRALVYTSIGGFSTPQLVALDPATGVEQWRADGALPMAADMNGAVAYVTGRGLVAFDTTGAQRWTYGAWPRDAITSVLMDRMRNRVYVNVGERRRQVDALDATTGRRVWRTNRADNARVLNVVTGGTALTAIDNAGRHALRAIRPSGVGLWQFNTTTAVVGANRLNDGTVAFSTANSPGYPPSGLLWRANPRRLAAQSARTFTASLSRAVVPKGLCFTGTCLVRPNPGTVLRIASPRAIDVSWEMRLNGRRGSVHRLRVPSGQSRTLLSVTSERAAGGVIVVRRGVNGPVLARLPIRFR